MGQQRALNELIEKKMFEHYSQPIFNLERSVKVGEEFLLRAVFGTPDFIFHQAKKANRLYELDTLSIQRAIETLGSSGKKSSHTREAVFVNIFPSTLLNSMFPAFIDNLFNSWFLPNHQIIFELNENDKECNLPLLRERIRMLKEYGCRIAFDDVGKGPCSINAFIEFEPNYIKLDRYFSFDLNRCSKKQSMIRAIMSYCRSNNIHVVLEGIENEEEFQAAKELGVSMGQGYLLGRPEKISKL